MRVEHIRHADVPMVAGDGTPDDPLGSEANKANGFTAVNGENYSNCSFRPDDATRLYMPPYTTDHSGSRRPTPINSDFQSHGWRPDDRSNRETSSHGPPRELSPTRKRKRSSISVNVDNPDENHVSTTDADGRQSPKRRATSTLDSAIDLTSPVTNMQSAPTPTERRQHEPPPIGPYQRERSPVARWNRGEPPPKPRPEIEVSLAESINKFHQTQQSRDTQQGSPPAGGQHSPPKVNVRDQQEASASDEDEPQGDSTDLKKGRKRNFSNRTKTGCHTCRGRKKKCDERKPTCGNCERGNFSCAGYGPKPPNGTKVVALKHLNVQPKAYEGASGVYYQTTGEEAGRSYSHWGRVPANELPPPEHGRSYLETSSPEDPRYPSALTGVRYRHGWEAPVGRPSPFQDRFPPPDYPHGPWHRDRPSQAALPPPQQPAGPPNPDPFAPYPTVELYHRPSTNNRPPTVASSHSGSAPTHSSQHQVAAHLALSLAAFQPSEKDKMLRGQPFLHWLDNFLIGERDSCSIAVDCYNKGSKSDKGLSREAKAGLFAQILDPGKRIHGGQRAAASSQSASPVGTIKQETIVESPFKCDYGYNIHLGASTVLQAGCYLQDAADVTIGDRVIVGPDVKIHTLTASVDCGSRKGSQGQVVAGAVYIEDDVFIGANAIILPYCTIGRGAVVGAGSVVTRDVKENTVVAGNPAKPVRTISPSGGAGEGQADRRYAHEIQERNERVKKRMVDYANSGFNRYSPQLI